jgi:hypothetical protein
LSHFGEAGAAIFLIKEIEDVHERVPVFVFDPPLTLPYQRFRLASPFRANGFFSKRKSLLRRLSEETDSRACDRAAA